MKILKYGLLIHNMVASLCLGMESNNKKQQFILTVRTNRGHFYTQPVELPVDCPEFDLTLLYKRQKLVIKKNSEEVFNASIEKQSCCNKITSLFKSLFDCWLIKPDETYLDEFWTETPEDIKKNQ